jgi:hypothetical protein
MPFDLKSRIHFLKRHKVGCFPFGGEAPCGDKTYWSLNPSVNTGIIALSWKAYINKKLSIY